MKAISDVRDEFFITERAEHFGVVAGVIEDISEGMVSICTRANDANLGGKNSEN